jgi:hypothetical protein
LVVTHLSTWRALLSETATAPGGGIYARINLFYTELGNLLHSVQQHTISFSREEMGNVANIMLIDYYLELYKVLLVSLEASFTFSVLSTV